MADCLKSGYLTARGNKDALLRRFDAAHTLLREIEQDNEDKPNIKHMTKDLVDKKVLHHKDKDVRLMASCCIAEVLRIYEAPYDSAELVVREGRVCVAVISRGVPWNGGRRGGMRGGILERKVVCVCLWWGRGVRCGEGTGEKVVGFAPVCPVLLIQ